MSKPLGGRAESTAGEGAAWLRPPASLARSVLGVGIDLVMIDDVRRSIATLGDRYLHRVFTSGELAACSGDDPAPGLAARAAAKEAIIKALRVEGAQPPWMTMEVVRDPRGWCEILLWDAAADLAIRRGVTDLQVSLTHEGGYAGAIVVATGGGEDARNTAYQGAPSCLGVTTLKREGTQPR